MAKQKIMPSYVVLPSEIAQWAMAGAMRDLATSSKDSRLAVTVRRLPEGVYLAVCEELPGLIAEADTRDDLIDMVAEMAIEFLELEGRPTNQQVVFYFEN